MGALEWYNAELEKSEEALPPTKRRKPRKRLATVVLDKYLKEPRDNTAVVSPEKLVLKDDKDYPSSFNSGGIQKKIFNTKRKRLIDTFYKGRTLRRLIQITHLGILFNPDIRTFYDIST